MIGPTRSAAAPMDHRAAAPGWPNTQQERSIPSAIPTSRTSHSSSSTPTSDQSPGTRAGLLRPGQRQQGIASPMARCRPEALRLTHRRFGEAQVLSAFGLSVTAAYRRIKPKITVDPPDNVFPRVPGRSVWKKGEESRTAATARMYPENPQATTKRPSGIVSRGLRVVNRHAAGTPLPSGCIGSDWWKRKKLSGSYLALTRRRRP